MGRRTGVVTLAILQAILDGHRYGADVIDATALGGGTVYKTLGRLERRGWIEGQWEDADIAEAERRPRRRFYRLTSEGRAQAAEGRREVERLTGIARARG